MSELRLILAFAVAVVVRRGFRFETLLALAALVGRLVLKACTPTRGI